MAVINTNVKALFSQAALASTSRAQSTAMQQLSTGKRINSARDDAAGMAIATRMTHQIRSLNQAVRNAGDAISMIQTAEGATNEVTDMLLRMRELAIQAANDTNSNDQRSYLDLEFQQLKQQIVQIADNTEWNGFPLLNGTAGEPVGPFPVYKETSVGQFTPPGDKSVRYYSDSVNADNVIDSTATGVKLNGELKITMDGGAIQSAMFALDDGSMLDMTGDFSVTGNTLTYGGTDLVNAAGTFTLTSTSDLTDQTLSLRIGPSFDSVAPVEANDVIINGVTVPKALAKNDTVSPRNHADILASSAIARAAAINEVYGLTGVRAVVQPNLMSGTAMKGEELTGSSTGSVTINGYTTAVFTTVPSNTRASREAVVKAINMISEHTGVVAKDTGEDLTGITLTAADGRNIEMNFNVLDASPSATTFANRTGLKEGLQIGNFSLEAKVENPLVLTSSNTGSIDRSGLRVGDFTSNITRLRSQDRAIVSDDPAVSNLTEDIKLTPLHAGDLTINGVAIPASDPTDDVFSMEKFGSDRSSSAIAIAAAINAKKDQTGVNAVAIGPTLSGTPISVGAIPAAGIYTIVVNGIDVSVALSPNDTADTRTDAIIAALKKQEGQTGVVATKKDNTLSFTTNDGRNLSIWMDKQLDVNGDELKPAMFGLKSADVAIHDVAADTWTGTVKTYYGTVELQSDKSFTVKPGSNGYDDATSNFTSLGFVEGTYGGRSSADLSPPRVGRMNFQVGSGTGQTISFELADFGKGGPITQLITWDVDLQAMKPGDPVPQPGIENPIHDGKQLTRSFISSREAALDVLNKLDVTMDKVNATRATMGAVMNRLDHVISNLTNVSMNLSASRSQIEDADYASASTDLAKTQIMQQAATAVLAQANTSQQSVLKLLQGG